MPVPYFAGDHLLVAASRTGANALSTLIRMLEGWMEELGVDRVCAPSELQLYEKLVQLAGDNLDSSLEVGVTLWGERHDQTLTGSAANLTVDSLSLGSIASATMRGIVENLHAMMPEEILASLKVLEKYIIFFFHEIYTS